MNSAVRRFILFFFSIATLAACDDPTDIGIELQDDNKIGTDFTDTLTIKTGTVLLNDSILSYKRTPGLIGYINDANTEIGKVRASYYTQVGLGGTDVKFGENPVADSLVITLDYTMTYGSSVTPMTFKVYELAEGFQEKESYFTSSELARKSELLGSKTILPAIEFDSKKKIEKSKLIRIKLNPAFTQKILAESGKDPLKTQQNFNNFIKGLAFVVDGETDGRLIALNVAAKQDTSLNQTLMKLYYKNGSEKKTHNFVFHGSNLKNFSKISSDRTGTALASLQSEGQYIESEKTGGLSYVQAGTQLFTKLSIPYLKNLKEKHGNFVINRAELIIPVNLPEKDTLNFAPPAQLVMYETNASNRVLNDANGIPKAVQVGYIAVYNTYLYPTALYYNNTKKHYAVDITSHVQGILFDVKENSSLLIAPAKLSAGNGGTFNITPEIFPYRAVLSNTEAKGAKLRIYFSKLN